MEPTFSGNFFVGMGTCSIKPVNVVENTSTEATKSKSNPIKKKLEIVAVQSKCNNLSSPNGELYPNSPPAQPGKIIEVKSSTVEWKVKVEKRSDSPYETGRSFTPIDSPTGELFPDTPKVEKKVEYKPYTPPKITMNLPDRPPSLYERAVDLSKGSVN